jgi:YesN/AraC family two-component response regulator
MVVDDEPEIAAYFGNLIKQLVNTEGDVEIFKSGSQALARMREEPMDLLISDIVMPVTNGLSLLNYIVKSGLDTEVIFLTAYENFEYLYEINKIKRCGYIIKSEKEEMILAGVQEMLDKMNQKRMQQETITHAKKQIDEVKRLFSEEKVKQLVFYDNPDAVDERRIIHEIREYIKEHIHEDITIMAVAEVFHYSPTYLSKIFKKFGKENISKYILDEKLKTAKLLLVDSDKSIGEISAMLGYQMPQTFARAFRRELSMTPQEYRRKYRKSYLDGEK